MGAIPYQRLQPLLPDEQAESGQLRAVGVALRRLE